MAIKQRFLIQGGLALNVSNGTAPIDTQSTTLNSNFNADYLDGEHGSFYRNASNINAGTIPAAVFTDTSHGDRAGGTLHAAATQSVAGFMSAADKTKLDGLTQGATTFLGLTDTPSSYATHGLKLVRVNAGASALEFVDGSSVYLAASLKGAANGVAELDAGGKVPAAQLPSYVDDVLEYANAGSFPGTGESGKIYVAADTSNIYRWSGSAYINISASAGTADEATKLSTPRTIEATGDATWSVSFDGSANVSGTLTLATVATGATATKVTFNNKGLITSSSSLAAGDIPSLDASKITTGTLPVERGGTGVTTITGIVKGNGTSAFSAATAGTDYLAPLANVNEASASLTTSTTAANQVVTSFAAATFRTAKFLVQLTSSTGYHATEVLLVHDDTNVYMTEYASIFSAGSLGTLDADISGGNVRLLVSPVNAVTTIRAYRISINV